MIKRKTIHLLPDFKPSCAVVRGVTLVELLVVIAIMIAVMAVAIPVVRLTTNDNRVTLATQSIRSFLQSAALQADQHGKSYVIFERNTNVPDFCYRLYQGRPRPPYRGEDESAYALMAPNESVVVPGVPVGDPPIIPGPMAFNVFYLYNADPAKVQPYEYLSFRDRPEKYLIYQAFQMPNPAPAFGILTKVYCRLDPQMPLSSVPLNRSGLQPTGPGSELQTIPPHPDWSSAANTAPQRNGGGPISFWPADLAKYSGGGPAVPSDVPNFQPGSPGQFTSRLLTFEVSQPPMIDELNYLDLPQGMAIYLGASGFGDIDGFDFNGVFFNNFAAYRQLAFRADLGSVMASEMIVQPALSTQIDNEVQDLSFQFVRNESSPIRAEYYPRIEFEAGGRISRAFAMSPRFTAAASVIAGPNTRITRQGPINPLFPLYLLVGEDNVQQRQAQVVLPSDFWIMLGAQTSTPKIVKAQVGVPLDQAHANIAASLSEH